MNNEVTFKTTVTPEFPSAWSLFVPSLKALKLNQQTFLSLAGIVGAAFAVIAGLVALTFHTASHSVGDGAFVVGIVVFAAVTLVLSAAFGLTTLESSRGKKVSLQEMWQRSKPFIARYALFQIYFILLSCVGVLLFVVPYLFVLKRYLLAPYYLLDENLSVIDAMKRSAKDSKDAEYKSAFWGLAGVTIFISIIYDLPIPVAAQVISVGAAIAYVCAPAIRYLEVQNVGAQLLVKSPKKPAKTSKASKATKPKKARKATEAES